MAVLIITHDLGVVANLAEEVVVLYEGRVMEQGPDRGAVRAAGAPLSAGAAARGPAFRHEARRAARPRAPDRSRCRRARAEDRAVARRCAADPPRRARRQQDRSSSAAAASSASARGPTFRAVDDVSFSIPRGECFGLVGESGCGKTTLSKVIMRALEPDGGQVLFNDRGTMVDVVTRRPRGADALPAARPVHFPGPVRLAQSADDGVRHPARAARDPRDRRRRLPGRDGEGADAPRRARPALSQSLSAQLLRRPAPAHRHRPRARA